MYVGKFEAGGGATRGNFEFGARMKKRRKNMEGARGEEDGNMRGKLHVIIEEHLQRLSKKRRKQETHREACKRELYY